MTTEDRCTECGYPTRIHFKPDGTFLGCPLRPVSRMGHEDAWPRIQVRIGKAGTRKGKVLVAWPDVWDQETGQIMVWDIGTGDQFLDDQYQLQRSTRRATKDEEREAREEVEYRLGGKVRVVANAYARGTEE